MRVLILGANGMLGHKLMQRLGNGHELFGATRRSASSFSGHPVLGGFKFIGGVTVDDFQSVVGAVDQCRPDVIINAVGLIKQLPGAKDPIPSISINSLLPHKLAQLSAAVGARFFHISTDCVFSGRKGNYTEQDETDALDLYGRSKLLGEVIAPNAVTLRTSIVGRELETASGLFEWFISHRGREVKGFTGAIYTGLTTAALSDVIRLLIEKHRTLEGLWQVSAERITKYDLLGMLNTALGLGITIHPDGEYRCDRSLDSARFQQATGWRPPTWRAMIDELARDTTPYDKLR